MASDTVSNYPTGVTAGSHVFDLCVHKDDLFCDGECNSEQPHTVTIERNIETAVCQTCEKETETDLSEPDPDEQYDRQREDKW